MDAAMSCPADTESMGHEAAAHMAAWQWSDYWAALGAVLDFLAQSRADLGR